MKPSNPIYCSSKTSSGSSPGANSVMLTEFARPPLCGAPTFSEASSSPVIRTFSTVSTSDAPSFSLSGTTTVASTPLFVSETGVSKSKSYIPKFVGVLGLLSDFALKDVPL